MSSTQPCPHCGSADHRRLADKHGPVCWCSECHRAWIPSQGRRTFPMDGRTALPARAATHGAFPD